jgi:hypothetical protein
MELDLILNQTKLLFLCKLLYEIWKFINSENIFLKPHFLDFLLT